MLNGIHGHQDIERVVYGRAAGPALRAEAERLEAERVFLTTSNSVARRASVRGAQASMPASQRTRRDRV